MTNKVKYLIKKLNLIRHIEGGYYFEYYRAKGKIKKGCLPKKFKGDRVYSTSIYFLLQGDDFSAFHKLKADEVLHFYDGVTLLVYIIYPDKHIEIKRLGRNIKKGDSYQILIEAGCWCALKPEKRNNYSLIGCTVSPGFEYDDFTLAKKEQLIKLFPEYKDIIEKNYSELFTKLNKIYKK